LRRTRRGLAALALLGALLPAACTRPEGDFGRARPGVVHDAVMPALGLFAAASREEVDAVHAAAVAAGAEVLHAPREWPEYHPGYYAVFLRDPDGHNVEAVVHH